MLLLSGVRVSHLLPCCPAVSTPCLHADAQAQHAQYFCIENYKPIGQVFRNVSVNEAPNSTVSNSNSNSNAAARVTSGHTARWCSTFCDSEAACTAFRAVGADAIGGPTCQLLTQTTADLPADLVLPPGAMWAHVLSDFRPRDGIALRSLAWLCFRGVETWETFGRATHALIQTGVAGEPWASCWGGMLGYGMPVAMWSQSRWCMMAPMSSHRAPPS